MRKVRELKSWIEGYEQVTSAVGDLQVLFDFAKEGEATEEEVDAQYEETVRVVEDIEMRNMLRKEERRVWTGQACSTGCISVGVN